jgi:two-component sensor histidine kinase
MGVTQKDTKKDTKNNYAFAGQIIRLTQANFDTWAKAYPLIDLRAQLQALDDYYDNHLTGGDRNKWFARCSQALAKKNERARAGQGQQREEPKFNDGVY